MPTHAPCLRRLMSTCAESKVHAINVGDVTLPKPTGPHSVGFIDVEFRACGGRSIVSRLFYPTTPDTPYTKDNRGYWLPSQRYYPAYGHYLGMPSWLSGLVFKYLAGHVQIWAIGDAPVAPIASRQLNPFVVFSHGIGGIRTTYSVLCTELASHGFVVGALEHQDGSAAMSVNCNDKVMPYQPPPIHHEYNFRNAQLEVRVEEVGALIRFVLNNECEQIVSSTKDKHVLDRIRGPRRVVFAIGHSMGAATAFMAAQHFNTFPNCRIERVVGLDPWMYPLPVDTPAITTPAIAISLQHFEWPGNHDRIKAYLNKQPFNPSHLIIEKADHADQSDVNMVMPRMMRWRFRTPGCIDPELVLCITQDIVLEFLESGKVSNKHLSKCL